MKLYGSKRKDTACCSYGCCGGALTRSRKHTKAARAARKAARKRARQADQRLACASD